jgi:hypothetical protein
MKAGATLAVAVVMALGAAVVRADRQTPNGLIGSLFPTEQTYETVDYNPPRLPALKPAAAPVAQQQVAVVAEAPAAASAGAPIVAEAAPAYIAASAFAAAPDLASANDDGLVAVNTSRADLSPQRPGFEPPELAALNVLDSDAKTADEKAVRRLRMASFEGKPCGDACSRAALAPVEAPEHFQRSIPNPDLRWQKLPCSEPGNYRYQLFNDGDKPYTKLVVYNGGQRWDIGSLESHGSTVLSSPTPFGRRTIVDHDAHFDSSWSQRR